MSLSGCRALSAKVDNGLATTFGSLATAVTARPILVIIATTALAFALAPGMVMGESEQNGENLWVPQDTMSKDQSKWVRSTFGEGPRRGLAYSLNNDANVLTQESLEALEKLQKGMWAVTAECELGTCDGKTLTYSDVREEAHYSVLSIFGDVAPPPGTDILAAVNNQSTWYSSSGQKLSLSDMLGSVTYDANDKIISAQAMLTTIWLRNNIEEVESTLTDPWAEAWELEFDDFVKDFSTAGLAKNHPYTKKGRDQAGGDAIKGDVSMLSIGYMLLIVFSIIVLSHHKRIESNGVMAVASILSVGLAIVSAFGLGGYLGVKQNPVTTTLFLVLLGIGVDDSYVIMGDYRYAKGEPRERVINALRRAGTSIAVTSATDTVAFAAGATSTLPALSDFCIFAAFGIFFDFFYQCTWFVAVLQLRARCTNDNRPDWLCCMQVDPESTGCCACSLPLCSRGGKHVCCPCTRDNEQGESESMAKSVLLKVTDFTLSKIGSAVILFISVCLLAGAFAGIPTLETNFDIQWFVPEGHLYAETDEIQKKYFARAGGYPFYTYTKSGNYAAAHADGSLTALYQKSASCDWVDRTLSNWYNDFVAYSASTGQADAIKASETAFASTLKAYVESPAGKRFASEIVFETSNGAVSGIQGARALFFSKESSNGKDDMEFSDAVRGCIDGVTLDSFAYNDFFMYFDGLAVVDKETIQNVIIACVCVFIVNLIMLGDILAAGLVLLMIALIDVCILGYMAHWDLDFNSVTAINLVLAVGLAVDYSAHIAHSFLVTQAPTGPERARHAVEHIGISVLNGAFSTFLAIFPLCMSKSFVFQVFFKMWFMIIIFGVFFGVLVLPVLLSLLSGFMGAPATKESSSTVKPENGPQTVTVGKDGMYIANQQGDNQ